MKKGVLKRLDQCLNALEDGILTSNALEEVQAIRYDLDRYTHIIEVVESRRKDPTELKDKPLLDNTEIMYVIRQLADARGTIAYYRKRNSDPSGRW